MTPELKRLLFWPDKTGQDDHGRGEGSAKEPGTAREDGGSEDGTTTARDLRIREKVDSIIKRGEEAIAKHDNDQPKGGRPGIKRAQIAKAIDAAHAAHEALNELRQARRTGEPEAKIKQLAQAYEGSYVNASELASKANFTLGMSPQLYGMLFGETDK